MNNEFSGVQPQLDFESAEPFFSTPSLNGLIQQISHLAQFGSSLIVVEGPQGSGKSVLARKLDVTFSDNSSLAALQSVRLSVPDQENIDAFFSRFCAALGLPVSGSSAGESIVVVRSYVQSLVREHKLCLAFIDDADMLSDETLAALLSVLDSENVNHGIHLVLMARPGLAGDIDRLSSVSLAAYDFSMPNFSPTELERFIEFITPSSYTELFQEKGVWTAQSLWSKSGGFPGPALALIDQSVALDTDSVNGDRDIPRQEDLSRPSLVDKAPIPFLHAGILVVLIGSLIWMLLGHRSGSENTKPSSSLTVNQIPLSSGESLGPEKKEKVLPGGNVNVESALTKADELSSNIEVSAPPVTKTKLKEISDSFSDSSTAPVVDHNKAPVTIASVKNASVKKASNNNVEVSSEATTNVAGLPSKSGIKAAPGAIGQSNTVYSNNIEAKPSFSRDESFLLGLPSSHYVLQILAASKPDSLQKFIQSQPNRKDLRMYQGSREGKRWYVVVIASFASRADAVQAIQSLPAEQSKAGPWVKPISTVMAEIKENRRI